MTAYVQAAPPRAGVFVNDRPVPSKTQKDLALEIANAARDVQVLAALRVTPRQQEIARAALDRLDTAARQLRREMRRCGV